MNLFSQPEKTVFDLPDAEIEYYSNFFDVESSNYFFEKLKTEIYWQQDPIKLFGKQFLQPRLTSFYGDESKSYSYSNMTMYPHKWTPLLLELKNKVESFSNIKFSSVLLNYYRDGKDSNGWHADNEKELGKNPIIASVSFGAERFFHLKHNENKAKQIKILLENGSLLIMKGTTQHYWKHQIPKTTKKVGERINLTFRQIA